MQTIMKSFTSFSDAKVFACLAAETFNENIQCITEGDLTHVIAPQTRLVNDPLKVVRQLYLNNWFRERLSNILAFRDVEQFRTNTLVWFDKETGLTWDTIRSLTSDEDTESPAMFWDIMNEWEYGGVVGWRMPTVVELMTLTPGKQNLLRLSSQVVKRLWAKDNSGSRLVDLSTMTSSWQTFYSDTCNGGRGRDPDSAYNIAVTDARSLP